jgi:hypothetical protein
MSHTPTTTATSQLATVLPLPAELSLEERLTLIDAAMTVRLDEATVAYEVNTAHIATEPVDLADVVTGPVDTGPAPLPDLYPTPVAALLQRAQHRLLTGGWCSGVLVDADGARCLLGAIRAGSGGDRGLEADAAAVLLDAIHRTFGEHVETVPSANDHLIRTQAHAVRLLGAAADLADARGL